MGLLIIIRPCPDRLKTALRTFGTPLIALFVIFAFMDDKTGPDVYILNGNEEIRLPLMLESVSAGVFNVTGDYIEKEIDLTGYLIRNKIATVLLRVAGDSMTGAGIFSGDILVVDRSLSPQNGDIIIPVLNSMLSVRRFVTEKGGIWLKAENPRYKPVKIAEFDDLRCFGVVTFAIHNYRK